MIKELNANDFDFEGMCHALNTLIRHHNRVDMADRINYLRVDNGNDPSPNSIPSVSGLSKTSYGLDKDGKFYESFKLDRKEILEAANRVQEWIAKTELVEIIKIISKNKVVFEKLQAGINEALSTKETQEDDGEI